MFVFIDFAKAMSSYIWRLTFLEKNMKIVFVVLIDTTHFLVYEIILSRSSLIISAACKILLFTTLKLLVSVANRKLSLFKSLQILLI